MPTLSAIRTCTGMNYQPLRRDLLPAGSEDRAAQPLAEAVSNDEARARAMWAFAHGMVSLEIDSRFPARADLDEAWPVTSRQPMLVPLTARSACPTR